MLLPVNIAARKITRVLVKIARQARLPDRRDCPTGAIARQARLSVNVSLQRVIIVRAGGVAGVFAGLRHCVLTVFEARFGLLVPIFLSRRRSGAKFSEPLLSALPAFLF